MGKNSVSRRPYESFAMICNFKPLAFHHYWRQTMFGLGTELELKGRGSSCTLPQHGGGSGGGGGPDAGGRGGASRRVGTGVGASRLQRPVTCGRCVPLAVLGPVGGASPASLQLCVSA